MLSKSSGIPRNYFQYLPIVILGLLLFGWVKITFSIQNAIPSTILLLITVTLVGLWFCRRTIRALEDKKLSILLYLWPLKLALTIFLLFAGWVTDLDPSSSNWGGDPIRYYYDAFATMNNNWVPIFTWDGYTFSEGLGTNYTGILYYYGMIFYLFGHNPLIPALFNSLVTLVGTLFLIRCAYYFMPNHTPSDWRIAYLLLIPEILWYDVMTSRETLVSALVLIAILVVGLYYIGRISLSRATVIFGITCFGIAATRTPMLLPVFGAIAMILLLVASKRAFSPISKVTLLSLMLTLIIVAPFFQSFIGGIEIDLLKSVTRIQSKEGNIAEQMEWSQNSIGLLLLPNNILQAIAFFWPRMLLYLSAPIPNINLNLSLLLDGTYGPWSNLLTAATSAMMLLTFPYVLAGTALSWRLRKAYPAMLIIPISFWMNFIAVAGGNLIIHERYRLMFTMLFFACMWIGYTQCRSSQVKLWAVPWFGILVIGAVFYVIYKFM